MFVVFNEISFLNGLSFLCDLLKLYKYVKFSVGLETLPKN
jgi:hypothetical protein